jgi:hypothetical protein
LLPAKPAGFGFDPPAQTNALGLKNQSAPLPNPLPARASRGEGIGAPGADLIAGGFVASSA